MRTAFWMLKAWTFEVTMFHEAWSWPTLVGFGIVLAVAWQQVLRFGFRVS